MPQFNSGAAEQIGRFSEGLLLRLLHPKPFTWTAKAKPILASHRRAQKALAIVKAGCK